MSVPSSLPSKGYDEPKLSLTKTHPAVSCVLTLDRLVDGCSTGARDILLSTERLRQVERVDPSQRTAIVGAGAPLQSVQQAAADARLQFPLDLGARGSATVGGAISTNAGGNRVIRFGMMRDLVLGVEAVLADGRIVSSMNTLIKNNTGYDLKQLFIGSEGTLGIVTRAVLRLWPARAERQMALAGLPSVEAAGVLLSEVDRAVEGRLTAFEAMWPRFYELACGAPVSKRMPLNGDHDLFVLIEVQGGEDARDALEMSLGTGIEAGVVNNVVVARSEADCETFWSIRDNVEPITALGDVLMYDVGLPLAAMPEYVANLDAGLARLDDVIESFVWGHIGDGNLHVWIVCRGVDEVLRKRVNDLVYNPLADIGGSISAEHGIGREKREYLSLSRSREEIELMTTLKRALDPHNRLNPGKLLPDTSVG